jgi:phosphoglycerate kinase
MEKLSLADIPLKGKKVLMRVDFNVPQNKDGSIADDSRIKEALPSIKYVLDQGGSLILMSHLGRPKGKKDPKLTLAPCAKRLSELIQTPVAFASDCIGTAVENAVRELKSGQILLLENLRFYAAEEDPDSDPAFAQNLAQLGDVYVNDAFGTAHREHSSTASIAKYFPGKAAAGFLLQKEVSFLSSILSSPKRPFYTIIGGSKISTKMGVLNSLLSKVDGIFIGGGMAFTFLKAQGIPIGNSIHEDSFIENAKEFLKECQSKKVMLRLPKDLIIAEGLQDDAIVKCVSIKEGIADHWQGLDIGPATVEVWKSDLSKAATVFWNGPLGMFENPKFASGTNEIAKALSTLKATTIVGGGDSVSAINALGIAQKFSHVSTGGGASLEFIEFGRLPGIDALSDK